MDDQEPPTITILLLGDPDCGKSTFLLSLRNPPTTTPHRPSTSTQLPPLHDTDQPFTFTIRLYARFYRFEFHDTASPHTHWSLLTPDFVILCYDVSERVSLENVAKVWFKRMVESFMREREDIPVMLLGLKRDLRVEGEGVVEPMEGLKTAQSLRLDRYAECSAVTGELLDKVIEDIARTAAKTTTENGAKSEGGCVVM